jgi:hypothetical protein
LYVCDLFDAAAAADDNDNNNSKSNTPFLCFQTRVLLLVRYG